MPIVTNCKFNLLALNAAELSGNGAMCQGKLFLRVVISVMITLLILIQSETVFSQSIGNSNAKDSLSLKVFKQKVAEPRMDEFEQLKHLIVIPNHQNSQEDSIKNRTDRTQMISYFGFPDIQESTDRVGYYLKGRFNPCCVMFQLDREDKILSYTINQCQ